MGQIEYFLEKSENQELYGHFTEYHQPSFTDCVQPPRVYKYVKIISVVFKPQKDITAYELAVILGILEGYKNGRFLTEEEYKDLPERIRKFLLLAGEE